MPDRYSQGGSQTLSRMSVQQAGRRCRIITTSDLTKVFCDIVFASVRDRHITDRELQSDANLIITVTPSLACIADTLFFCCLSRLFACCFAKFDYYTGWCIKKWTISFHCGIHNVYIRHGTFL